MSDPKSDSEPENAADDENKENEITTPDDDAVPKRKSVKHLFSKSIDFNGSVVDHQNYPCICETFIEPETGVEKVILVISLPSGAQNTEIDVSNDGKIVKIAYYWSQAIYNYHSLFKTELEHEKVYHPMFVALQKGLQKVRTTIEEAPKSIIQVGLPIKVQTTSGSWTNKGITCKDSVIVIAKFQGFHKDYYKKKEETIVKFEKTDD